MIFSEIKSSVLNQASSRKNLKQYFFSQIDASIKSCALRAFGNSDFQASYRRLSSGIFVLKYAEECELL